MKEQNCFSRISVDFNLLYAKKVDFKSVEIAFNVSRPEKRIKSRHLIYSF